MAEFEGIYKGIQGEELKNDWELTDPNQNMQDNSMLMTEASNNSWMT